MLDKLTDVLALLLGERYVLGDVKDALAMHHLAALSPGYVPWSGLALRPSAVVAILNDIVLNRRSCIVECGGGVSTLYIANLLKQYSFSERRLFTIEHDEEWVDTLHDMLAARELTEWVSLIHAPLTVTEYSRNGIPWYDARTLEGSLPEEPIDLVIVDGPPACRPGLRYARYPAAPFFKNRLAECCSVMVDDMHRRGEQALVDAWEEVLGSSFERRRLDGNIAIGGCGEAFDV